MAQQFPQGVDLLGSQLKHALLENLAADPSVAAGKAGMVWFDTVNGTLKFIDGAQVINLLNRATQTGSQAASTISDLAAVVKAYRLDEFAAPTAARTMGGQQITGLAAGSASGHAVEYDQLNAAIATATAGLAWKEPVRAATTANITLSGTQTVDTVALTAGQRVLVKNQTTAADNGIYVVASGAWTRAADANSAAELQGGTLVAVDEGGQADTAWMLAGDVTTLGTTSQSWIQFGSSSSYTAGNGIGISAGVISAVLAASGGLAFSGSQLALDNTIAARKVTGAIPAATSGIFTVSGATVTVAHGLNNSTPLLVVRAGATPPTINGYATTTGQEIGLTNSPVDANNLSITLPAAPASGNYTVTVIG